ncbi:MAG: translation initiation factor IF-2, partial [Psittacicella sp.]
KASKVGPASGTVIESSLDKNLGAVATVLVRNGTLHKGDIILCGNEYGKIRLMRNELGKSVKDAGPSLPVEILGLSGVVAAGDKFQVLDDERTAREIATNRKNKQRDIKLANQHKAKLENMFSNIGDETVHLNVVLKADVQGSLEAIIGSLKDINTSKAEIHVIGSGVGGITESDVVLASASNAILVGFNVRANSMVRKLIESEGIDLRYYSVVYDLLNEIKSALSGLLAPEFKQEIIGLAEVRDVFKSPKLGAIAGCMVTEGIIKRNNPIRVLRDDTVIYEGELESLRRFKDDVNEVKNGFECGIGVKNYNDIKIGDQIEVFENVAVAAKL